MERFREIVINLAICKLNKPLTSSQLALIENALQKSFPAIQKPTHHPTYASMIEEAVKKLVEEGSLTTEQKISEYITKNYEGLPWAHGTYLKHHLVKACERGELICNADGSFSTPDQNKPETLREEPCEQNDDIDGSNRDLEQNVRRSSSKKLCEAKYGIDASACDPDQKVRRSLREKPHEVNYNTDGSDGIPQQKEQRNSRRKLHERNNDFDGSNCAPAQKEQISLRKKLPEINSDVNGSDCAGDQNEWKRSRSKRLKKKSWCDIKEDVIERNLAQEEANELSDNQVGLPEVAVQEELGRGKRKRMPKHIYDDEEDEVVQTRPVVGEGNPDSGNAIVAIETQNEMLLLKDGEVECKSSETENEDNGHVDIIAEEKSKPPLDVECSTEVNASALPENVKSISESNIARDDHQNSPGDLMLTPVALVSNIESDATESMRKLNLCASELIIVPYVDNSVNPDGGEQIIPLSKCINPNIVCGLPYYEKVGQSEKKLKVNSQRKTRSKLPKEKTKVQEEEPIIASLDSSVQRSLKIKNNRKSKSPKQKGTTLLEDTTVKQLETPKTSHASSLEIFSAEDEEPLSKVIEKRANLKKHGMQGELPSSENFVQKTPTVEKASASTKQLLSRDKTCDDAGDDTSGKSSSSFLEERKTKDLEILENQLSVVSDSTTCHQPDGIDVKHQQQQQKQRSSNLGLQSTRKGMRKRNILGPESPSKAASPADCFLKEVTPSQSLDGICSEATESALEEGSQWLNEGLNFQCPQKCLEPIESTKHHPQEEGPSEPTQHGASDNQHSEQEKPHMEDSEGQSLIEVRHQDLQPPEIPALDQDTQKQKRRVGRPPKEDTLPLKDRKTSKATMKVIADGRVRTRNQRAVKKDADDLLAPNPKEQEHHLQPEKSGRGRGKKPTETVPVCEPLDLWVIHEQEKQGSGTPTGGHLNQPIGDLEENEANILNLHPKQELSKPATRMRVKSNEVKDHLAVPLNLNHQQEVGLSEPGSNQQSQITKPKREKAQMQKEGDKDDEAIMKFSHQEQDGLHGSQNRQDRKNKRAESLKELALKELATKSRAASSNLQCPEQGDLNSPSHGISGASVIQSQIDLKVSIPETSIISCPDFKLSALVTSETSTCSADQSSQRQKDQNQPTRQVTCSSGAAKNLESQVGKQHDQELSDQRTLAMPSFSPLDDHCPEEESDQQQREKQYDDDQTSKEMEVQVKPRKEMSAKSSSLKILEASPTQSQINIKENVPATSDHPDVEHKPSRRVTRASEAAKILEQESENQEQQEKTYDHDQAMPSFALLDDHCPEEESDQEQREKQYDDDQTSKEMQVQVKPRKETSAKSSSVQILEASPTRRFTRASEAAKILVSCNGKQNQCPDQEFENQEQHEKTDEYDQACEEKEVPMTLRKDMSPRSNPIQVPLSSKDQLRSRMKRLSQDSS